jgi:isopenicillin N synthase-like dioxygenase
LLPLSEEPGLQIQTRDGRWLDAQQIDGAILVNTGEFLNRWTNGRFLATPHRVVTPKRDRYSIAFFFNPTWDTLATPLPTCVDQQHPAQYEPIRFLDYICWYVEQSYRASAGGAADAKVSAK